MSASTLFEDYDIDFSTSGSVYAVPSRPYPQNGSGRLHQLYINIKIPGSIIIDFVRMNYYNLHR